MREHMRLPGPGTHWIWIPTRMIFWSGVGALSWAGALYLAFNIR